MKRKLMLTAGTVIVIIIIVILCHPFSAPVDKTVQAYVFEDDSCISETTVKISGKISGRIWDEKTYIGTFGVEQYEKLCRDGVQARIVWEKEGNYQSILFSYNGDFTTLGTEHIIIDSEMNEFALRFDDGIIVATSEEMYEKTANNAPAAGYVPQG